MEILRVVIDDITYYYNRYTLFEDDFLQLPNMVDERIDQ